MGTQYRTGVYYTDEKDLEVINQVFEQVAQKYDQPLAVEKEALRNFIVAEDYHQDYLQKNPNGYCHINVNQASYPVIDASKYPKPSDDELKKTPITRGVCSDSKQSNRTSLFKSLLG